MPILIDWVYVKVTENMDEDEKARFDTQIDFIRYEKQFVERERQQRLELDRLNNPAQNSQVREQAAE